MSIGAFDEEEHERREKKISSVAVDSDERRTDFEGRVEFTDHDSLDELLSRLDESTEA